MGATMAPGKAPPGVRTEPKPPRLERKLLVQFLASEAFMKKFERARALLSNRLGTVSYEAVLETVLDEFLERHTPENKTRRRDARRNVRKTKRVPSKSVDTRGRSRRIPAAIRDAVSARDQGRCTYVGTTGKRCGSTRHLQIDHIVPFARGGTNVASNLRLLCARHNKIEAERIYGANAIKRFHARE